MKGMVDNIDCKGIILGDWTPVEQSLLERQHQADVEKVEKLLELIMPTEKQYWAGYVYGLRQVKEILTSKGL